MFDEFRMRKVNINIESNKIKEDTATKIKYMLEEKFQLEQEIRAGEDAQIRLNKLEHKLKVNMMLYAGINESSL